MEAGARTGLASIVTGSAFLLSLLFIGPFVAVIPDAATTCALVMVGVFSLQGVLDINFGDICGTEPDAGSTERSLSHTRHSPSPDYLPAFFTIMTMAFTYSIANGICAGFIWFSVRSSRCPRPAPRPAPRSPPRPHRAAAVVRFRLLTAAPSTCAPYASATRSWC